MHQRDVTRALIRNKIDNPKSFEWLSQMRFYFDPKQTDVLQQLSIQMANAKFNYGFEYLGVQDKLVQTPLTDRCYLTMTQALEARLGGSPFGQCLVFLTVQLNVTCAVLKDALVLQVLPEQERPSLSKLLGTSWAASSWSSTATRPLTSR